MTIMAGVIDSYVAPGVGDINYVTGAVHFDGATYLRRSGGISGQGTVTSFTWSIWTKISVAGCGLFTDLSGYISQTKLGVSNPTFRMFADSSFDFFDSDPAAEIQSASWQGIFCSGDIEDFGLANFYRGDTNIIGDTSAWDGPDTIPQTTNFYFGTDSLSNFITGDVADFRLWMGQYLDLSTVQNRRLFVRANGKPADPTAAIAALGTPSIEFAATPGSEVATFSTNGGSGGTFTTTGTLTVASSSPTD